MTKKNLRKEFLTKRVALPNAERIQLTEKIVNQFTNIHLPNIVFALSYLPIPAKAEIETHLMESELLQQCTNCSFCYPKIDAGTHTMQAIIYEKGMPVKKNEWGIYEPESIAVIDPQQIDIVFVPLLAFDKRGYRVGYGKGFYDRFIARCRPDVMTIGLSFFEPVESIDDTDEYDMPLAYCITPEQVFQF